jgi:hypothetical protein
MSRVAALFGSSHSFIQAETLRFPIYLTLIMALLTLTVVFRFDEIPSHSPRDGMGVAQTDRPAREAFRLTLDTGRWILRSPFVLGVILFGMLFDGILRMVITLASQYYRMVQLPESIYGILGAATALTGLFIPRLALRMAQHRSPAVCLGATAAIALTGLSGMALFWPYAGLVPALVAFSALYMVVFYVSYFVNQHTSASRRATVLSFKGLACNLAYGFIGIAYAGLLEAKTHNIDPASGNLRALDNLVFKDTFFWFPLSLAAGLVVITAGLFLFQARRR